MNLKNQRPCRIWIARIFAITLMYSAIGRPENVSANTYIVTTTADPGTGSCTISSCSLHDAIDAANANLGPDTITFAIPGSGIPVIRPVDPLPTITDPVTIDASTQSPSSTTPPVELRGDIVSANEGFVISSGGDGSTIKGFIINRFPNNGISIQNSQQNTIAFNWIGLDATGLAVGRNAGAGIFLQNAPKNSIGGQGAAFRNVISGNGGAGIQVGFFDNGASSENVIKGNYIGTNYLGDAQIPNQGGIDVMSSKNTIGGTATGEGNVISGYANGFYQLDLHNTDENLVYANYIGTNAAGSASLSGDGSGSLSPGINIEGGNNNRIGTPGGGNLISGTLEAIRITSGVSFIEDESATGNIIQANFIGTDAAGTAAIPNSNGIRLIGILYNVSNNTIGGNNTGEGNLISGNGTTPGDFGTGRAIEFNGPQTNANRILGNFIGVASDRVTPLGNNAQGILIFTGSNNLIGDTGAGNIIAYNGDTAVSFVVGTGNKISQNSIFSNGGFGINEGVKETANPVDPGDTDVGPNNLQNFPEFGVTIPSRGKILIKGELDSTVSETFTLEFFLNDAIDDSGYGEGQTYLGSQVVTTEGTGKATFSKTFTATVPASGCITATATDSLGNTSEFSLGVQPTKDLKKGLTIQRAPVVAVVAQTVTVSLPLFKAPNSKKEEARKARYSTQATRNRKSAIQYQITITPRAGGDVRKLISKRNILTLKDLPLGQYETTYVASITKEKKVVAKSKGSPKKNFTVDDSDDL